MEPGEKTEDAEYMVQIFELDSDLKQYAWISFGFGAASCLLPLTLTFHLLLGGIGIFYGMKGRQSSRKGFAIAGIILSMFEIIFAVADFAVRVM